MIIADLEQIEGRTYPARRRTQNLVGGHRPSRLEHFSMGYVTLEPRGGQVPWHNQEQEEVYFVVRGRRARCAWARSGRRSRPARRCYIPPGVFHQLTNTGDSR